MKSINNRVISRIYGRGRGWVFMPNDFVDDFDRKQIDNALSDLVKEGRIRRIARGVYDYPKYSKLLEKELSPDFDLVAQAYARKFNWRIIPTGDAALNLLGLSTQVPGRLVYLSDGSAKKYDIDGFYTLEFKKRAPKDIGFKYKESGIVVQALKALGKDQVTESVLDIVRKYLGEDMCRKVLKDTSVTTDWVYDFIKKACKEND